MLSRTRVLHLIPAAALASAVRGAEGRRSSVSTRTFMFIAMRRRSPRRSRSRNGRGSTLSSALPAATNGSTWKTLQATLKVARDSVGSLAWASTFDARGFEGPGFADRTIARLRRSFEDGAIGVKIWKNIGMAIKSKSVAHHPVSGPHPVTRPTFLYEKAIRLERQCLCKPRTTGIGRFLRATP